MRARPEYTWRPISLVLLALLICTSSACRTGQVTSETPVPGNTATKDASQVEIGGITPTATVRPIAPLTWEAYYAALDAAAFHLSQELDVLDNELAAESTVLLLALVAGDEEKALPAGKAFGTALLEGRTEALERYLARIREIEPPAEAREWHHETVSAGEGVLEAMADLLIEIEAAKTSAEYRALLLDAEAGERLDSACYALEGIAEQHNVDANLLCGPLSLQL